MRNPCVIFCLFMLSQAPFLQAFEAPLFPYEFSWKIDLPMAAAAALLDAPVNYLKGEQKTPDPQEIHSLNGGNLNFLDATAFNNLSASQSQWSNKTLMVSRYMPFALCLPLLYDKQWSSAAVFAAMYVEAMSINGSLANITKSLANRARPYEYGSNAPVQEKLSHGKDGFSSFYSAHTSAAFCATVLLASEFGEMYPDSKLKGAVWGVSLGLAATTGVLRYTSGNHFPTDVLVGAVMGSLVGYLVPAMHKTRKPFILSLGPVVGETTGLQARFNF